MKKRINMHTIPQRNNNLGFTLVELMISISLGLLVVAAATQLYLTGQKSMAVQQGAANLQNSASFGLEYMLRDIRLANLGAKPIIDPTVLHGGIVLSKANLSSNNAFVLTNASASNGQLMTTEAVTGTSNLSGQKSDQLVIQYRNANSQGTMVNYYDCEGHAIAPDVYVVERYFLRKDTNRNDPNASLALACKATSYTGDDIAKLEGLDGKGEIIIPRVDHMRILLGVASDTIDATKIPAVLGQDGVLDRFGYISIEKYLALTTKPQIVSVQIGLLVRSPDSVGKNDLFDPNKDYTILDTTAKLKSDSKNSLYTRQVITQTVALRNGFGLQENPK